MRLLTRALLMVGISACAPADTLETISRQPSSIRGIITAVERAQTSAQRSSLRIEAVGVSLEKLIDGNWRNAWSPVLPACLSTPIAVAPGATRRMPIAQRTSNRFTLRAP